MSVYTFASRAVRKMSTTRTSKTDLRKQMKKVLDELPLHEKKQQSQTVIKKVNVNRPVKSAITKENVVVVQSSNVRRKSTNFCLLEHTERNWHRAHSEEFTRNGQALLHSQVCWLSDKFCTTERCGLCRYDGDEMVMVRLHSVDDWEKLPLTKWRIKQPLVTDKRENALDTGTRVTNALTK